MATQNLDLDEQEKLDQIKDFWRKHGNFITWALVLALVGMGSWFGYSGWQLRKATEASVLFSAFDQALQAGDEARIARALDDIGKDYKNTTYAQQAHLLVAKFYMDKGDYERAKTQLQYVIDHAHDEGHKAIARLRLAGLLVDQKNLDAALKAISVEIPAEFAYLVADRQGDIYALQGKSAEAKSAYEKAYGMADEKSPYRPMIEAKMRSFGVEPPAPQPAASQATSG